MKLIKKSTLRNEVSRRLRELILNNELKPGERIVETRIAKDLGVSQSPVREAIRELELMGLVENKPFLGCFVKRLTKKDIENAYKVRIYLEMLAVSEATQNITENHFKKMDELLSNMKATAKKELKEEFIELDISFHKLILNIADNSLLNKLWNMVDLGQWTFITTSISEKSLTELANRHEMLIECLKERNSEKASQCVKSHIKELYEEILIKVEDI